MKKTKYKATLPDGTVETRQSNRVYTHAVTRRYNNGTAWDRPNFCGSAVLAQKEANVEVSDAGPVASHCNESESRRSLD